MAEQTAVVDASAGSKEGGGSAEVEVPSSEKGNETVKIDEILASVLAECTPEEKENAEVLQKSLVEACITVPASQRYLALAFVRGFILDTYKDREDRVDLTKAEIQEAIKFRATIREQFGILDSPEVEALFEKHMHSFIPQGGCDFEGNPLWILDLPSPEFNTVLTKEQIMAYHARDLLKLEDLKLEASLRLNKWIYRHVIIADMSHSKGGLGGALGVAKKMAAVLSVPGTVDPTKKKGEEKNMDTFYFPESMHSTCILNAPWWFQGLWKVASLFMEPTTRKKIQVIGSNYADVLFSRGLLGHAPRYLGGCSPNPTALDMPAFGAGADIVGRVDSDGNPVPVSYSVKSGSPEVVRICFPATHRLEWTIDVKSRNLVLSINGYHRRETENSAVALCEEKKISEGDKQTGSFDCKAEGGGVLHGFVEMKLAGSSSFRSTTVTVLPKLVELGK